MSAETLELIVSLIVAGKAKVLMGEVVNIRDFKRPEERIAEIKRFADRLCEIGDQLRDTAPSEMPPVQPMYVAPEKDPA